jgi:succinylglutamic semialdehyde dehydrogenase
VGARDLAAAAAIVVQSAFFGRAALHRGAAADRRGWPARSLIGEITKLIDRIIVDHPHAEPAPFMGPVIDDMAARYCRTSGSA